MNTPKPQKIEPQMDTDASDFAQEVSYAVTHGGRELHPEQHEKKRKDSKKDEQPSTPWQFD